MGTPGSGSLPCWPGTDPSPTRISFPDIHFDGFRQVILPSSFPHAGYPVPQRGKDLTDTTRRVIAGRREGFRNARRRSMGLPHQSSESVPAPDAPLTHDFPAPGPGLSAERRLRRVRSFPTL